MFYNSGLEQTVHQLRETIDYRKDIDIETVVNLVDEIKEQVEEEMSTDNMDESVYDNVLSEMESITEYIEEGMLTKDRLEKIVETVEELIDYSHIPDNEED